MFVKDVTAVYVKDTLPRRPEGRCWEWK